MHSRYPTPERTAANRRTGRRIARSLVVVVAIVMLATVAVPASAQGNGLPESPPGQTDGNSPADIPAGQANKTAEEALRILGRHTFVL
jgi:hypothetical protein